MEDIVYFVYDGKLLIGCFDTLDEAQKFSLDSDFSIECHEDPSPILHLWEL